MTQAVNSRRQMSIMFAIGLIPVVIAFVVYNFFPQYLPKSTTNVGTLILPPIQSELVNLPRTDETWTLVIPVKTSCDERCEKRMYFARQVNTALGKNSERVVRVLAAEPQVSKLRTDEYQQKYPGMELHQGDLSKLQEALDKVHSDTPVEQQIFLMDPIGNIMMFYDVDNAGNGMLKDIKHLLKISNIG